MGSWLGRVAARYRMGVAQLVKDYDLQIPLQATGAGWLLLPPLNTDVLQRLAGLARMKIDLLQEIQTPDSWLCDCKSVFYCRACLFVNPEDVFSPMWKRQWFDLRMRSINRVPCAIGAGVIGTAKVRWRTAAQRPGNARRQGKSAS